MSTSCDQLKLENEAPWTLFNHPLGSLINSTWWSAKTTSAINQVLLIDAGKVHCPESQSRGHTVFLNKAELHTTEFTLLDCPTQRSFYSVGERASNNISKYLCTSFAKSGVLQVAAQQGPCSLSLSHVHRHLKSQACSSIQLCLMFKCLPRTFT